MREKSEKEKERDGDRGDRQETTSYFTGHFYLLKYLHSKVLLSIRGFTFAFCSIAVVFL